MPNTLPDYERHPLDEMVIGVQFEPLANFGIQQIFNFQSRVRNSYPAVEEQVPLQHQIEADTVKPASPKGSIKVLAAPLSRYWFVNSSGTELLQVQRDRLLRNWRLRTGEENYPRYESLFDSFWKDWKDFRTFLSSENVGPPKVDQCELTYVNYINLDEIKNGLSGIENAFKITHQPTQFLPPPETVKWESSYLLPDGKGRLRATAVPSFRQRDLKLIVNFTLSVRGKPIDGSDQQVLAWFDLAHEWIVRAFDDLTTPAMHEIWKKKP